MPNDPGDPPYHGYSDFYYAAWERRHVTPPSYIDYNIGTLTGDEEGAGTDANMTVTIQGELGTIQFVLNPAISGDAFKQGATDWGRIQNQTNVGPIINVFITSDHYPSTDTALGRINMGSDWLLRQLWIQPVDGSSVEYAWDVGRWIEDGKKDEYDLPVERKNVRNQRLKLPFEDEDHAR